LLLREGDVPKTRFPWTILFITCTSLTKAELKTTQGWFPGLNESLDTTIPTAQTFTAAAEIAGDGEQQESSNRVVPVGKVIQAH